jgi:hypothetical protein
MYTAFAFKLIEIGSQGIRIKIKAAATKKLKKK